jgi:hypothetical protein
VGKGALLSSTSLNCCPFWASILRRQYPQRSRKPAILSHLDCRLPANSRSAVHQRVVFRITKSKALEIGWRFQGLVVCGSLRPSQIARASGSLKNATLIAFCEGTGHKSHLPFSCVARWSKPLAKPAYGKCRSVRFAVAIADTWIELRCEPNNSRGTKTITDDMTHLRNLVAQTPDADIFREMIRLCSDTAGGTGGWQERGSVA